MAGSMHYPPLVSQPSFHIPPILYMDETSPTKSPISSESPFSENPQRWLSRPHNSATGLHHPEGPFSSYIRHDLYFASVISCM